jgi:hypothetical protein
MSILATSAIWERSDSVQNEDKSGSQAQRTIAIQYVRSLPTCIRGEKRIMKEVKL